MTYIFLALSTSPSAFVINTRVFKLMLSWRGHTDLVPASPESLVNFALEIMRFR